MPLVVYYSYTNKTENFIDKLRSRGKVRVVKLEENTQVHEPFVLITPTYSFGEIPIPVTEFLKVYGSNLLGVMSSGNRNWGENFAKAGDIISKQYEVDLIGKFEMYGNEKDVDKLLSYLSEV